MAINYTLRTIISPFFQVAPPRGGEVRVKVIANAVRTLLVLKHPDTIPADLTINFVALANRSSVTRISTPLTATTPKDCFPVFWGTKQVVSLSLSALE